MESAEYQEMSSKEVRCKKTAFAFAALLVAGEYEKAYEWLSSSARKEWSVSSLKTSYEEMTEYFEGILVVRLGIGAYFTEWNMPEKMPEDVATVFVGIDGEGECEAVTVVICQEQENYRIRDIEWGRP